MELPRLISVDDHVVEPADLWQRHLPAKHRAAGPRLERIRGRVGRDGRKFIYRADDDGAWADCWVYDDHLTPLTSGFVAVCFDRDDVDNHAVLFDELLPGCYDQRAPWPISTRTTPKRRCASRRSRGSADRRSSKRKTKSSRSRASGPTTIG